MALPKYKAGETVLFVNTLYPEFIGPHRVNRVKVIDGVVARLDGMPEYRGFVYYLDGVSDRDSVVEADLRKEHQPGDMGFAELVAMCNRGISREDIERHNRRA